MPESPAPEPGKTKKTAPQPPRRSRFWKWTRRFLIAGVICSFLGVIALFAARAYFRSVGNRELAVETAKLDAEEPGWRLPDLIAAREKTAPPDEQNSAVIVRHVRALTPKEWNDWAKRPNQSEELVPLNRKQRLEDIAGEQELIDATREARDLGLTLRTHPRGYHAVKVSKGPFIESLEETTGAREVVNLLRTEALLTADANDPIRGLRAAHAVLNTGRSIGDEPSLISQLVRMAGGTVSAEAAMRILALTDTKLAAHELAALQTAFVAEADEQLAIVGFRGERAFASQFFENLDSGKLTLDELARTTGERPGGPDARVLFYFRRAFLPGDYARYLRYMSGFLEALNGPANEMQQKINRVETSIQVEWDIRYIFSRLMASACGKVASASLRHRAELRSAAVLIACERFRHERGRWPTSLAELPKELLRAIPLDPYDGAPIKFAKLPDGITVYTVGAGPNTDRDKKRLTNPLGGTEIGWRLYDPQARGLPPIPPKEKPDEKPDGEGPP